MHLAGGHSPLARRSRASLPRGFAATLALFLLASVAEARGTGGTVRVVRGRKNGELHLFTVRKGGSNAKAQLESLSSPIPGLHYSLLDTQGFVGELEAKKVGKYTVGFPTVGNQICEQTYYSGDAEFTLAPRREVQPWAGGGGTLAVGPLDKPATRARLVLAEDVARPITPDQDGKRLEVAIDLDGEGDPELFMYEFHCDGDRVLPWNTQNATTRCLELWSREGRYWEVVARAQTEDCGQ